MNASLDLGYTNFEPTRLELAAAAGVAWKILRRNKISALGRYRIRGGVGYSRPDPSQLEHPVPNVTVLGQMGRSHGFTAAGDHLIERIALSELRVELAAKLTWTAGAGIEAINDGWINVFHEKHLLGLSF